MKGEEMGRIGMKDLVISGETEYKFRYCREEKSKRECRTLWIWVGGLLLQTAQIYDDTPQAQRCGCGGPLALRQCFWITRWIPPTQNENEILKKKKKNDENTRDFLVLRKNSNFFLLLQNDGKSSPPCVVMGSVGDDEVVWNFHRKVTNIPPKVFPSLLAYGQGLLPLEESLKGISAHRVASFPSKYTRNMRYPHLESTWSFRKRDRPSTWLTRGPLSLTVYPPKWHSRHSARVYKQLLFFNCFSFLEHKKNTGEKKRGRNPEKK